MADITKTIKDELTGLGADIVGFGDLRELPADVRRDMPYGICVAVKFPPDVIKGISELPTKEYHEWYNLLNERLDKILESGAEFIRGLDYNAFALTRAAVGSWEGKLRTTLPHKTVATRAGIGWIGKSALLVTKEYGSMIRLSTILTDAPIKTAKPINKSKCGGCLICTKACPAGAITGKLWNKDMPRDEFFDAEKCRIKARERSKEGFGAENVTICGKCIEVCPWTRRHLA
ncbi:MAG: 4Fe-4S dicluster domain-containing protein [Lachnospiraceae bacterium]|jgi:epoxyqueuosine reductase QueG|nr:4Fe-4S dicluster domain-containing protein [Lachnospiraceae bacterium]